jgi:hypothetical protein
MDTDVEKTTHDEADKTADDRFFSAHDFRLGSALNESLAVDGSLQEPA